MTPTSPDDPSPSHPTPTEERFVPDSVIPHHSLPPLKYRDLPEPISWRKMIGPSIMLAGLSLGSGEFVLWPYITYKTGFVFFWACLLGVATQFFMNMEIERWTLATGESAITGFCRLSRQWAWVFLLLNILPWIWPGWASGAGQTVSWLIFGAQPSVSAPADQQARSPALGFSTATPDIPPAIRDHLRFDAAASELVWTGPLSYASRSELLAAARSPDETAAYQALIAAVESQGKVAYDAPYYEYFGVLGLLLVGCVLTAGPVVYNTVERVQFWLVGLIFVSVVVLACVVVRADAVAKMAQAVMNVGGVPPAADLELLVLLGALAFAGAGGTMNLGQSNYIKDKGYAMGRYVGRITSPITGQEEPTVEIGYHFEHTPENIRRWNGWWRAANIEHFFSFFCTCVVCLVLLALIAYSLFHDPSGARAAGTEHFQNDMNFVWGEAMLLERGWGPSARVLFLILGAAILLTTEFGVLDATSRISTDVVKVNYLRDNAYWTQSRLYYLFLWSQILIGSVIVLGVGFKEPLFLLVTSAAMNGVVMMIYSILLLYLNSKILSRSLAIGPFRFVAMIWASAFFGYFTLMALQYKVIPAVRAWLG